MGNGRSELAASHVAMLSAGEIEQAFPPPTQGGAVWRNRARAGRALARCLIEQVSAGGRFVVAA